MPATSSIRGGISWLGEPQPSKLLARSHIHLWNCKETGRNNARWEHKPPHFSVTVLSMGSILGAQKGKPTIKLSLPASGLLLKSSAAFSLQMDKMSWAWGARLFPRPWKKLEWNASSFLGKYHLHMSTRSLLYWRQGQSRLLCYVPRKWRIWLPWKLAYVR